MRGLISGLKIRLTLLLAPMGMDKAQGMVEYALILALVTVIVIIIIMVVGNQTKNLFCNISGGLGA